MVRVYTYGIYQPQRFVYNLYTDKLFVHVSHKDIFLNRDVSFEDFMQIGNEYKSLFSNYHDEMKILYCLKHPNEVHESDMYIRCNELKRVYFLYRQCDEKQRNAMKVILDKVNINHRMLFYILSVVYFTFVNWIGFDKQLIPLHSYLLCLYKHHDLDDGKGETAASFAKSMQKRLITFFKKTGLERYFQYEYYENHGQYEGYCIPASGANFIKRLVCDYFYKKNQVILKISRGNFDIDIKERNKIALYMYYTICPIKAIVDMEYAGKTKDISIYSRKIPLLPYGDESNIFMHDNDCQIDLIVEHEELLRKYHNFNNADSDSFLSHLLRFKEAYEEDGGGVYWSDDRADEYRQELIDTKVLNINEVITKVYHDKQRNSSIADSYNTLDDFRYYFICKYGKYSSIVKVIFDLKIDDSLKQELLYPYTKKYGNNEYIELSMDIDESGRAFDRVKNMTYLDCFPHYKAGYKSKLNYYQSEEIKDMFIDIDAVNADSVDNVNLYNISKELFNMYYSEQLKAVHKWEEICGLTLELMMDKLEYFMILIILYGMDIIEEST